MRYLTWDESCSVDSDVMCSSVMCSISNNHFSARGFKCSKFSFDPTNPKCKSGVRCGKRLAICCWMSAAMARMIIAHLMGIFCPFFRTPPEFFPEFTYFSAFFPDFRYINIYSRKFF